MKTLSTTLILSVLTAGICHAACPGRDSTTHVEVTEDALISATHLSGDTVMLLDENIQTAYCLREGIAITIPDGSPGAIGALNLESGEILGQCLSYGAEDGNFLSYMTSIYRDTLIVLDVIKGQTALINMDSLAYSKGYSPKIIQSGESESNIGLIPYKGSLLRLNPYCFRSPDGEIDNHDHRRFIPPSDETHSDRDYDYLTHNVSQGTLVANPDRNKIVFCREYENIVEIYEYSSLRKIMEISGPCDFGNSFQVYSNGLVIAKGQARNTQRAAAGTADWFITIFQYDGTVYTFMFDWNGNLLGSYILDNAIDPYTVSVSTDGKSMFLVQFLPDGNKGLFKYNL